MEDLQPSQEITSSDSEESYADPALNNQESVDGNGKMVNSETAAAVWNVWNKIIDAFIQHNSAADFLGAVHDLIRANNPTTGEMSDQLLLPKERVSRESDAEFRQADLAEIDGIEDAPDGDAIARDAKVSRCDFSKSTQVASYDAVYSEEIAHASGGGCH